MIPHREVSARRPGKALCSCSTDPLVTSATYLLFTADQKGIFHGSAFIGFPYFPEIISQFCKEGKKMGVITPSGCPSRLCARLYVDFKAGDTSLHMCVNLWVTCAAPWEPRAVCPMSAGIRVAQNPSMFLHLYPVHCPSSATPSLVFLIWGTWFLSAHSKCPLFWVVTDGSVRPRRFYWARKDLWISALLLRVQMNPGSAKMDY